MADAKVPEWEGAGTKLPSGHRIFETHADDGVGHLRWAIAGPSGFPQDIEGGILWLDTDRSLDASTGHRPLVPVVDSSGARQQSVRIDTPTILYLSRMFQWTIVDEVRGHYYSVR